MSSETRSIKLTKKDQEKMDFAFKAAREWYCLRPESNCLRYANTLESQKELDTEMFKPHIFYNEKYVMRIKPDEAGNIPPEYGILLDFENEKIHFLIDRVVNSARGEVIQQYRVLKGKIDGHNIIQSITQRPFYDIINNAPNQGYIVTPIDKYLPITHCLTCGADLPDGLTTRQKDKNPFCSKECKDKYNSVDKDLHEKTGYTLIFNRYDYEKANKRTTCKWCGCKLGISDNPRRPQEYCCKAHKLKYQRLEKIIQELQASGDKRLTPGLSFLYNIGRPGIEIERHLRPRCLMCGGIIEDDKPIHAQFCSKCAPKKQNYYRNKKKES